MQDEPAPDTDDVEPEVLRERWDAASTKAMEGLHEQTEERLRELQARIRRSRFRLIVNSERHSHQKPTR